MINTVNTFSFFFIHGGEGIRKKIELNAVLFFYPFILHIDLFTLY